MNKLPSISPTATITEVGAELIAYDSATSKAHCLSEAGSAVLRACRDSGDFAEVAKKLGSEEAVHSALVELQDLGLVTQEASVDRRKFLVGIGVGVASVLVASVAAPTPVSAASVPVCRLDEMSRVPCDCATCGQPCSGTNDFTPCVDPLGGGPPVTGSHVCCFEYNAPGAAPPVGKPQCFREGSGDYQCRGVAALVNYNFNCSTSRPFNVLGLYYCCCCDSAGPAKRNCC